MCVPKVYGQPGGYAQVSAVPGLKDLPNALRRSQFEVVLPNGRVVPVPAGGFTEGLWAWKPTSFIELRPDPAATPASALAFRQGDELPARYDRAGLAALLLGPAVAVHAERAPYKDAGVLYHQPGVYGQFTASSLLGQFGLIKADELRGDLNKALITAIEDSEDATQADRGSLRGALNRQLEKGSARALRSLPVRILTQFRDFHRMSEGDDVLPIPADERIQLLRDGDDSSRQLQLSPADAHRVTLLQSPHPVGVLLPYAVPPGTAFHVRNTDGPLRVPSDARFDATSAWAAHGAGSRDLFPDVQYTFTRIAPGWAVSASPILVNVDPASDGIIVEKSEIQGVTVRLPQLDAQAAGWSCTLCNRTGPLTVAAPGVRLRRVPEDLGSTGQESLDFGTDVSQHVRWDGEYWNLMPETTDDEFNRSIAGLTNYPEVSRAIGLVWDVEIPLSPDEVASMPREGLLRLAITDHSAEIRFHPFSVACSWQPLKHAQFIAFVARPRDAGKSEGAMPVDRGLLDLSMCAVNQAELDVPARNLFAQAEMLKANAQHPRTRLPGELKLTEAAERRRDLATKGGKPTDPHELLPAMTEAGLEIIHPSWHIAHLQAAKENNRLSAISITPRLTGPRILSSSADVLHQEVVTRGCRFDVQEIGGDNGWHALCGQSVTVSRGIGASALTVECRQESAISAGATGLATAIQTDKTIKEVLRGSDVIFRWTGWSAGVPKPIDPQAPAASNAVGGLGLVASSEARTATQYPLRIGRTHRFRARLVDVAGNGWSAQEADAIFAADSNLESLASPSIKVARVQPSKPPKFFRRVGAGGEEVRNLVVRSYDSGPGPTMTYRATCPRVPFELGQMLGVTRGLETGRERMQVVRAAHDRSVAEAALEHPEGAIDAVPGGKLLTKHLLIEDPDVFGIAWRFLPGQERPVSIASRTPASLATGDPILAGAPARVSRFRHMRLHSGRRIPADHIAVVLEPGTVRSHSILGYQVHVTLPVGESQYCLASSCLSSQSLKNFALWQAFVAAQTGLAESEFAAAAKAASLGAASTLTPPVVLQLIHASQRPVRAPIVDVEPSPPVRKLGDREISMTFTTKIHAPSTGRLDLEADWMDAEDEPASREWSATRRHEAVQHWPIDSEAMTFTVRGDEVVRHTVVHQLPDTRRRRVSYTMIGTSRYMEFFNRLLEDDAGNTKRERGVQTTNVDPYLSQEEFVRSSRPVVVDIPNAQEPAPFEIDYIVPKPRVEDSYQFGGSIQSVETTRELRVYFRRPAFLTGEGEMLGVLITPVNTGPLPPGPFQDEEADAVCEIAEDPLSFSVPVARGTQQLGIAFFPEPDLQARTVARLPAAPPKGGGIRALDGRSVTVLGYAIQEIPGEDLLYADVRISATGRAAPFLKLALVRYQPHSVMGAHVSNRPAFAWVRPHADRTINVQFKRVNGNPFSPRRRLVIQVVGPAPVGDDGKVGSLLTLQLSRRKSSSAGAESLSSSLLMMTSEWRNRAAAIASWSAEIDVEQFRSEDEGDYEEGIKGHCAAHLNEVSRQVEKGGAVWFADIGLGSIRWTE